MLWMCVYSTLLLDKDYSVGGNVQEVKGVNFSAHAVTFTL